MLLDLLCVYAHLLSKCWNNMKLAYERPSEPNANMQKGEMSKTRQKCTTRRKKFRYGVDSFRCSGIFHANETLGKERPDGANDGDDDGNGENRVLEELVRFRNFVAKELQMEQNGEGDADRKAQGATHKCHDAVKGREEDRNDQEHDNRHNPDGYLGNTAEVHGPVSQCLRVRNGLLVHAGQDLDGGDDGAGVERDLCERDDGNKDAQEDGQGSGVAGRG